MEEENKFKVGDHVIKNPITWMSSEFDSWGRGVGIGTVVDPPFFIDDLECVDVRWPAGRCFEDVSGIIKFEGEEKNE